MAKPIIKLHRWAAAVQLFTSIVLFAATDTTARAPVYTLYWRRQQEPLLAQEDSVIVGYYSGAFLFLSFLNHAISASCSDWYEDVLDDQCNPLRWLEYFFSASIMHVMIAHLCGVADAYVLLCIGTLTAMTMVFGWLQETLRPLLQKNDRHPLTPFWLGCFPWVVQWIVILLHFGHAGSPPEWVTALIVLEIILDALFAALMLVSQVCSRRFEKIETGYIILSLTAKQALAWVNFGGTQSL